MSLHLTADSESNTRDNSVEVETPNTSVTTTPSEDFEKSELSETMIKEEESMEKESRIEQESRMKEEVRLL
ncbi:hypothetical protein G6F56_014358 [Rhizopus delemar]|nr:hypothetical protein G6F56_014358 [Rhizopus delemar]